MVDDEEYNINNMITFAQNSTKHFQVSILSSKNILFIMAL